MTTPSYEHGSRPMSAATLNGMKEATSVSLTDASDMEGNQYFVLSLDDSIALVMERDLCLSLGSAMVAAANGEDYT